MREIKFRAKNKENNKWYYSYIDKEPKRERMENELESRIFWQQIERGYLLIDTLGQFTGLTDKNGKDIYEEDILDFAGLKPIEIIWKDNGFKTSMLGSEPINLTQEGFSAFGEIIGNIYENKELIK